MQHFSRLPASEGHWQTQVELSVITIMLAVPLPVVASLRPQAVLHSWASRVPATNLRQLFSAHGQVLPVARECSFGYAKHVLASLSSVGKA